MSIDIGTPVANARGSYAGGQRVDRIPEWGDEMNHLAQSRVQQSSTKFTHELHLGELGLVCFDGAKGVTLAHVPSATMVRFGIAFADQGKQVLHALVVISSASGIEDVWAAHVIFMDALVVSRLAAEGQKFAIANNAYSTHKKAVQHPLTGERALPKTLSLVRDTEGYGFLYSTHMERGATGNAEYVHVVSVVDMQRPAEAAGVMKGQRIIGINGTNVTALDNSSAAGIARQTPPFTNLELTILESQDSVAQQAALTVNVGFRAAHQIALIDAFRQQCRSPSWLPAFNINGADAGGGQRRIEMVGHFTNKTMATNDRLAVALCSDVVVLAEIDQETQQHVLVARPSPRHNTQAKPVFDNAGNIVRTMFIVELESKKFFKLETAEEEQTTKWMRALGAR